MIWSNLHWWRMLCLLAVRRMERRGKRIEKGRWHSKLLELSTQREKQFEHRWWQPRGIRVKGSKRSLRKSWWMGFANRFYMESESDGIKNLVWHLRFLSLSHWMDNDVIYYVTLKWKDKLIFLTYKLSSKILILFLPLTLCSSCSFCLEYSLSPYKPNKNNFEAHSNFTLQDASQIHLRLFIFLICLSFSSSMYCNPIRALTMIFLESKFLYFSVIIYLTVSSWRLI